jgi:predicted dehydrogenase
MVDRHHPGMDIIRWGIIGCGDVCEVKSGPAFQQAAGSALVAVMRRDGAKAADFARRHGVPRWYDDAAALVADPEVDAVYVASPVDDHECSALLAAAARKPCYVEKPMARSHAECQRMLAGFAAAGVPLFVAYYRRALPRFAAVRQAIQDGQLGTLTGVDYRFADDRHRRMDPAAPGWRLSAERAGGGLFLDLGSHVLDLIAHLVGDLEPVAGVAANRATPCAVEDSVALAGLAGGVPCAAQWNFAAHRREDRLRITGSAGEISCSVFGDEPLQLSTAAGDETIARPNPRHIQLPLIQTIVDELRGHGRCPSTGATAARTSAVMDTVLAAYYGGRDDAFWTREATWPGRRG